ncbi:MAG: TrkH family potassium uptake protein, partial [Eggerthellaceae bacterium]|nr:TrkH family potassium uptake protein [Eggerthellaceae bacterium]
LMLIGGSAGSTSGGIKIMRLAVLGKEAAAYIKEQMAPSSARQVVTYYHVGRHPLNISLVRANLTVFVLFVAAFAITGIATVAYGYDAMSALFESAAMVSNSGMTTGITSSEMPVLLKILYMFDMWAGRLEWVSLIALLVSGLVSLKPRKRAKT